MSPTACKNKKNETALRGTITHLYFSSDRFTAGRVSNGNGGDTSFAGKIGGLRENDRVIFHGRFEIDDKYGEQFKVSRFEFDTHFDKEGIVNYISTNPEIKGIGFSRALKIAEFCGDDFDRIVTEEPERLVTIPGITAEIAKTLHDEWVKHHPGESLSSHRGNPRLRVQKSRHHRPQGGHAERIAIQNPFRDLLCA